jgi:hypothetical protein
MTDASLSIEKSIAAFKLVDMIRKKSCDPMGSAPGPARSDIHQLVAKDPLESGGQLGQETIKEMRHWLIQPFISPNPVTGEC